MTGHVGARPPGTSHPVWLDADGLRERIGYAGAAEALWEAFATSRDHGSPERWTLPVPAGELMLMPAYNAAGTGVKLVTLTPGNRAAGLPFIHGVYALFAPGTQQQLGMIDGKALTDLRTATVSALVTRALARPDARRVVIFGAGVQARTHGEALREICPWLEEATVVSRTAERAEALVGHLRELGWSAQVGDRDALDAADVVCCCTTAVEPVLDGARVAPGTHVNAVGSYRADRRELDGTLLARATVVVEEREAALHEAGDIALAIAEGAIGPADLAGDVFEIARGEIARASAQEITVFKSVGMALEDLVVAQAAIG